MKTFSTILFIDQAPIGYRVARQLDRVEFDPATNPGRQVLPPRLVAEQHDGRWLVLGTHNEELIRQVLFEVALTDQRPADASLSAAP